MCFVPLGRVVTVAPATSRPLFSAKIIAQPRRTFSAAVALQFASPRESPLQWTDDNYQALARGGVEPHQLHGSMADLQRDWDVRILTYRQLKPKTQIPLSVRRLQ